MNGKVLALDYGKKRIGVASGDFAFKMAFPKGTILNKNYAYVLAELKKLCKEILPGTIVLGLPLNMERYEDKKDSGNLKEVKLFAGKLKKDMKDVQIELIDERLSSFEADTCVRKFDKDFRGKADDSLAAQIILQRYFDSLN